MYELTRAQQWLVTKLRQSAPVAAAIGERIYEPPAPQPPEKDANRNMLPYIIVDHRAGTDTSAGSGTRIGTQMIFAVEIVTETQSNLALEPIYDAIDDALQGATGTNRGIIIDLAVRDSNYAEFGIESGSTRRHVGALWRLFVRQAVLAP